MPSATTSAGAARLDAPIRDVMRPGVIVTDSGLLRWLERDLATMPAAQAITEAPHDVELDATARDALGALSEPGVSHRLVVRALGALPLGVVAPLDLVDLVTRP